jgi:predicted metal-dependent hydrolase
MTDELQRERAIYLEGIRLFNDHEFFEAHETWEDAWNMAYGLKHEFYQGLIQCAVALEHYRRSNPRGVSSLFKSYTTRLTRVPAVFMGLDLKTFLERMHAVLRPVLEADPFPGKGQIRLDHAAVPRIELIYDPFETGEAEKFARPERF